MTRLELITLIGDVLTRIDVLRGSLLPTDPARHDIDQLRKELDKEQLRLAQNQFNDNTQAFTDAAARVAQINQGLKRSLEDVEDMVTTITNIKRFVAAVDQVVSAVTTFI